jgi:hypothetical protein
LNLVSKDNEEFFLYKIKEVAIKNYEKGEDVSLTQSQLLHLCSEINQPKETKINATQKTNFWRSFF